MQKWIIAGIFLLGGMGTLLRVAIQNIPLDFIYHEFFILIFMNCIGSLLVGLLSQVVKNPVWRTIWITGFCGGLTTMSTFSMQAVTLLQHNGWIAFCIYMIISVLGSILCCLLGMRILAKRLGRTTC